MFAILEENKASLKIKEYSLSQTSLEQIFNHFANQQEEEKESCWSSAAPSRRKWCSFWWHFFITTASCFFLKAHFSCRSIIATVVGIAATKSYILNDFCC
ncbi:unnamed protein product [Heterosigma akashiwo]